MIPRKIAQYIFAQLWQYPCQDPLKSWRFYEFILIYTNSIKITHNANEDGQIIYSKVKILKFLTPRLQTIHTLSYTSHDPLISNSIIIKIIVMSDTTCFTISLTNTLHSYGSREEFH